MAKPLTVWITTNCGKFLKDGNTGPPDLLPEKPVSGQEATVRTRHGTTDWFQIGKGVRQGCILSPYLFNLYVEYIMRNAGLDESQAGIKIAGRNINNLRHADDTILMAESEEELKSLLMRVKEESEKAGLKLNIKKTKIMASGPITSWEIKGEKVEAVTDFIFLGSRITADGDCSHEIKRRLLLGRKAMTNLDRILKSRDITLRTKSLSSQRLEMEMATYSSVLAWRVPWTEEPGGLQSMGSLGVGQTERLPFRFPLSCTGEGNGIPLQYSCVENPRDRGA